MNEYVNEYIWCYFPRGNKSQVKLVKESNCSETRVEMNSIAHDSLLKQAHSQYSTAEHHIAQSPD